MSIFKKKVTSMVGEVKKKMLTPEALALITEDALLRTATKAIQAELIKIAFGGTNPIHRSHYDETGMYRLAEVLARELIEEMRE